MNCMEGQTGEGFSTAGKTVLSDNSWQAYFVFKSQHFFSPDYILINLYKILKRVVLKLAGRYNCAANTLSSSGSDEGRGTPAPLPPSRSAGHPRPPSFRGAKSSQITTFSGRAGGIRTTAQQTAHGVDRRIHHVAARAFPRPTNYQGRIPGVWKQDQLEFFVPNTMGSSNVVGSWNAA